jgi:carbamate kinase
VRADGPAWRRVVPSPDPREIVELPAIRRLLADGVVVVAVGGGGVPVVRDRTGALHGVEAVIDKDLAAARLAVTLDADLLVLLTDVDAVYVGYGTARAHPLHQVTAEELGGHTFPAGSMGPKVEAACRFVTATGGRAVMGALSDVDALVAGRSGTIVTSKQGNRVPRRPERRAFNR